MDGKLFFFNATIALAKEKKMKKERSRVKEGCYGVEKTKTKAEEVIENRTLERSLYRRATKGCRRFATLFREGFVQETQLGQLDPGVVLL